MKVIYFIIIMDFFIFTLGSIFAEKEHTVYSNTDRNYHMDRYGYYWKVE